jgi:hypothetical protein
VTKAVAAPENGVGAPVFHGGRDLQAHVNLVAVPPARRGLLRVRTGRTGLCFGVVHGTHVTDFPSYAQTVRLGIVLIPGKLHAAVILPTEAHSKNGMSLEFNEFYKPETTGIDRRIYNLQLLASSLETYPKLPLQHSNHEGGCYDI